MDNQKPIDAFDPLAEPMWREAHLTRPEFSETLHARLRAAVPIVTPIGPQAKRISRRKFHGNLSNWAIATAAAIALLIGSALLWHTPGQHPGEMIVQTNPIEPARPPADDLDATATLVESTASGLGQWMETTVVDSQWAGLNHDAKTAMETVTGPLPCDLSVVIAATDLTE